MPARDDPPSPLPRQRRRRALVAGLVVVALATGVVYWRSRAVEVDAVSVQTDALQRTLLVSARVQNRDRVDIGATLTGRVQQVQVREGDRVTRGQPLVELEADELRAAVDQAQASLRQARARVASQQAVARPGADAALQQAQATLAAAEREYARTEELLQADFVSAARLDDARRAVEIARSQRVAAQAQAQANQRRGPETAAAIAQQDLTLAALRAAQARLTQATLRAPAPGQLIARDVEPGQIVQPGRMLLTLAVDGPTEIVAQIDERFLGQLEIGQRAKVLADAYPKQPFDAQLVRLAPAVDAQRGAVEATYVVDPAPSFLREDMTLSVETITGERVDALVLPLRAVRDGEVRVVDDGRAASRRVALGLRTLDQAEVTEGLKGGETVLLDPTIEPGRRVRARIVDTAQALRRTSADGGGDGISAAMGR